MNLPQNTITYSHNDLDGIGIGVLVKGTIGSQAEVHYCGYNNVDERINRRLDELENATDLPFILIADLGIKPETAERLNNYGGGKRWLDHHMTNVELASKYDWATIDVTKCGTRLVFEKFDVPTTYGEFVMYVNDYDLWIHNHTFSKELNRLLYIIGIERFELRFTKYPDMELTATEQLLLDIEEAAIERYTKKVIKGLTVLTTANDKRIGIGFAESYISEVAHEVISELELDAIALIDMNGKKISLRSVPNFDVGTIAKRLGGGGHKNAAGVEFAYGRITDFHASKYPLFGVATSHEDIVYELFRRLRNIHEELETEEITKLFAGVFE